MYTCSGTSDAASLGGGGPVMQHLEKLSPVKRHSRDRSPVCFPPARYPPLPTHIMFQWTVQGISTVMC